ncbi:hypothetical protein Q8W71_32570 [Methylobacterium sp. NEAU 140]|uniref:hypothetical protein n=1 Tax=Methylobacterium sp. NEAU 140 TaxID=3064945 RepID=UPI002732EE84|nr:hypothetical protein [Methylobacterium sp. NEAU 140]MDP4027298.1 hypothetical protein [Methylobacterium sp. NEAU 140]
MADPLGLITAMDGGERAMTGSKNDAASPSITEVADRKDASRKRLIENGGPPDQASDGQTESDDQPTGIVSEDEETGLIDPLKGK